MADEAVRGGVGDDEWGRYGARQNIHSSSHVRVEYPERSTTVTIPLRHELVSRPSGRQQFVSGWDELQRGNHLINGAKSVPRPMKNSAGVRSCGKCVVRNSPPIDKTGFRHR